MIQSRAWRFGLAFVHPLGAMTQNLEGKRLTDMAALEEAGCVGVSNALEPMNDTLVLRRAMEYAATFGLTVHLHAEDPFLRSSGCVHEGEVGTRLGLPGIPEAAETVVVARDLALIEQTGVRAHFCGLTSARAVAMVAEAQETRVELAEKPLPPVHADPDRLAQVLHNFLANGIFVHNSWEQDADVVMFIYRKDRDKLNPTLEEQNMAEIIIAKHRNGPIGSVQLKFDPEKVSFSQIDKIH